VFSEAAAIVNEVADGHVVAQCVALTKGFELFDHLPNVGFGERGRDRKKASDRLAVLRDREFLSARHSLQELGEALLGFKRPDRFHENLPANSNWIQPV
jgi:hypothetical protein